MSVKSGLGWLLQEALVNVIEPNTGHGVAQFLIESYRKRDEHSNS